MITVIGVGLHGTRTFLNKRQKYLNRGKILSHTCHDSIFSNPKKSFHRTFSTLGSIILLPLGYFYLLVLATEGPTNDRPVRVDTQLCCTTIFICVSNQFRFHYSRWRLSSSQSIIDRIVEPQTQTETNNNFEDTKGCVVDLIFLTLFNCFGVDVDGHLRSEVGFLLRNSWC